MSVWWIRGFPDDHLVRGWINNNGKFMYTTLGSINMADSVSHRFRGRKIILPGTIPRSEKPHLLVNEISSPETHANALHIAIKLGQKVQCPVINDPIKVLRTTREKVSEALQGRHGLAVPKCFLRQPSDPKDVFRLAEELSLGFPFLIRESGTHGGKTMLLIRDTNDKSLLHHLPYDGRNFYLSEFIDYRNKDGLFRKYRFVMVDGEPFLRHLLISPEWMIHASAAKEMENHRDWLDEEMAELVEFDARLKPRVGNALRSIGEALELDYWGLDCGIDENDRLIIFEANCNMNVTLNTRTDKKSTQPFIDKIINCFGDMVQRRIEKMENDRLLH